MRKPLVANACGGLDKPGGGAAMLVCLPLRLVNLPTQQVEQRRRHDLVERGRGDQAV